MMIAPSLLSADFAKLGQEVSAVTNAGADMIHFDVMDGHFVPNITFGPMILSAIRKYSNLPFEAHLMIMEPQNYWKAFADAGADIIGFHIEAAIDHRKLAAQIHSAGKKVCIVLNPPTKIKSIEPVLPYVEMVLVMTVNPGFGGQKFISSNLEKISWLNEERKRNGYKYVIEVDGGINYETAALVKRAGADILVAGSFIFGSKDYSKTIENLKCCE
ncbi:MAG: ribulose-phosphate 3-epimerase [Candidatus Omnitrophica bacterium]|nr:ribulose-phosphate 3-epimerase [Candidatus Omnitrophota bacterium]MCM8828426.1 ribulose-phosphate 3-epimerase [Candidatus Omnitrophota bacterium]